MMVLPKQLFVPAEHSIYNILSWFCFVQNIAEESQPKVYLLLQESDRRGYEFAFALLPQV